MIEKVSDSDLPVEDRPFTRMINTCESKYELSEEYVPSEQDVICGWARQNYYHGKYL
jgi:hypothetical protein